MHSKFSSDWLPSYIKATRPVLKIFKMAGYFPDSPCRRLLYRVTRNDCRDHGVASGDATPCDFFLWGYVKDQIYVPPLPASIPELKVRIRTATETITADMLQTVWNELDYRVDVCRITKGAHIEHLYGM